MHWIESNAHWSPHCNLMWHFVRLPHYLWDFSRQGTRGIKPSWSGIYILTSPSPVIWFWHPSKLFMLSINFCQSTLAQYFYNVINRSSITTSKSLSKNLSNKTNNGVFVVFKTKNDLKCQFSGNIECVCFHYQDSLTDFLM